MLGLASKKDIVSAEAKTMVVLGTILVRLNEIDAGITAIVNEKSKANKPKTFKKHTIKFMDDKHDEKIIARRKNS